MSTVSLTDPHAPERTNSEDHSEYRSICVGTVSPANTSATQQVIVET